MDEKDMNTEVENFENDINDLNEENAVGDNSPEKDDLTTQKNLEEGLNQIKKENDRITATADINNKTEKKFLNLQKKLQDFLDPKKNKQGLLKRLWNFIKKLPTKIFDATIALITGAKVALSMKPEDVLKAAELEQKSKDKDRVDAVDKNEKDTKETKDVDKNTDKNINQKDIDTNSKNDKNLEITSDTQKFENFIGSLAKKNFSNISVTEEKADNKNNLNIDICVAGENKHFSINKDTGSFDIPIEENDETYATLIMAAYHKFTKNKENLALTNKIATDAKNIFEKIDTEQDFNIEYNGRKISIDKDDKNIIVNTDVFEQHIIPKDELTQEKLNEVLTEISKNAKAYHIDFCDSFAKTEIVNYLSNELSKDIGYKIENLETSFEKNNLINFTGRLKNDPDQTFDIVLNTKTGIVDGQDIAQVGELISAHYFNAKRELLLDDAYPDISATKDFIQNEVNSLIEQKANDGTFSFNGIEYKINIDEQAADKFTLSAKDIDGDFAQLVPDINIDVFKDDFSFDSLYQEIKTSGLEYLDELHTFIENSELNHFSRTSPLANTEPIDTDQILAGNTTFEDLNQSEVAIDTNQEVLE